jgi:hypothetical protein
MDATARHISAKFGVAAQLVARVPAGTETLERAGTAPADAAPGDGPPARRRAPAPSKKATAGPTVASRDELETELAALEQRYLLTTSHLFVAAALGEGWRDDARSEFPQLVAREGFLGQLDGIVARAEDALGLPRGGHGAAKSAETTRAARVAKGNSRGTKKDTDHVAAALAAQYHDCRVDCAATCVGESRGLENGQGYGECPECHVQMDVDAERSELVCPECALGRPLFGTVFDESQYYSQEGQKSKSGAFNPHRHYDFWMTHLQAREPEEELGDPNDPDNMCGEKLLAELRRKTSERRKVLQLLSVADMRKLLVEVGRTDLNKNIPLLMRLLTGHGPPPLPEELCQRVSKIFTQAIEIRESIRCQGRANRNYYPYYIFKILDAILPSKDPSRRILYYIYLQGQDTIDKNDAEWELICEYLPDINWVATDRSLGQRYAPR